MTIKICQLCAVDFTLKHFLTALIDGMRDQGWTVTSVCSDGPFVPELRDDGYELITLPIARGLNPLKHATSLVRLVRLFRRERFDVLHAHTPIAALLGRVAARICGIPMIVYTAHGFYFHDGMRALPNAIFVLLERIGGKLTDLLFTQSAEDAATAVTRSFLPADRVIAIGNGVDNARFVPCDRAARDEVRCSLGIPANAIVIGMIGRMVSEKGYREFFGAAARMAGEQANAWFVAVGERLPSDHAGTIDEALRKARASLGNRLVLTGLRADVSKILCALDVFTLPSYREGMPRTIIEAMMMALPVVATDIRGSREEVVAGVTGILVPVRDERALAAAWLALAGDPAARKRMGAAGRMRALALYNEDAIVARQIAEIRARLPAAVRARA